MSSNDIEDLIDWVSIDPNLNTWTSSLNKVDFSTKTYQKSDNLFDQQVQIDSKSAFIHVPLAVYSRIMMLIDEKLAMCAPSID